MIKNKYFPIFAMLFITLCLGTSCNSDGGGSGDSSSPTNNSGSNSPNSGPLSIELSWEPPSTRVNGDKLYAYEIGGYEILYCGEGEENCKSITVHDHEKNLLSSYTITGISPGRYVVVIAVFDIDGLYSEYSDPVSIDKF